MPHISWITRTNLCYLKKLQTFTHVQAHVLGGLVLGAVMLQVVKFEEGKSSGQSLGVLSLEDAWLVFMRGLLQKNKVGHSLATGFLSGDVIYPFNKSSCYWNANYHKVLTKAELQGQQHILELLKVWAKYVFFKLSSLRFHYSTENTLTQGLILHF